MKELELYLHIPFCDRKCAYCEFLSAPAVLPVRISYIKKLQERNPECTGAFCGYGVAVKDFRNLIIEFDRNNTYIQSEGINQDFGVYDCPDELLKEQQQEISAFKAFAYRHIGRHLMNRNVRKIRER